MRLALFTDTFTPQVNGVARTLERFTGYLEKSGVDYRIFAPQQTKEHSDSKAQLIASVPLLLYPECRFALPNLRAVKQALQEFQPDLIHVATPFNMGLCGLYYAKKLAIPLVGSYHTDFNAYLDYYKMNFLAPMLWRYLRWFHGTLQKTFVPSSATLEQLRRKGFRDLHIWSRGVDCSVFQPGYETNEVRRTYNIRAKHLLACVGRLAPEKDMDTLTSLITATQGRDVHWLLVGDGPLGETLRSHAWPHVTFTGYLEGKQLASVYAAADLLVFPSPTETFGNVALEALACGTPVIGACAGGVKTIVRHNETGLLCPPREPAAFLTAIQALLADDTKRIAMSHAGRQYALAQNWDAIFSGLLSHYQEVIQLQTHISA